MITFSHGIDALDIDRIREMLAEHPDRFLNRCFTAHEQRHAADGGKAREERLAARFAAKEAAMKALGTGLADGLTWLDVEVVNESSGEPKLRLHGRAREIAQARGLTRWTISLTHTKHTAIASVVAWG